MCDVYQTDFLCTYKMIDNEYSENYRKKVEDLIIKSNTFDIKTLKKKIKELI